MHPTRVRGPAPGARRLKAELSIVANNYKRHRDHRDRHRDARGQPAPIIRRPDAAAEHILRLTVSGFPGHPGAALDVHELALSGAAGSAPWRLFNERRPQFEKAFGKGNGAAASSSRLDHRVKVLS